MTTQTQYKRRQTSMLRAGFEPTAPVVERAKTVHALDHVATVIAPGLLKIIIPRDITAVHNL
jgi:hypothetical protein